MVWSRLMWHFFHVATIWKPPYIFNLLTLQTIHPTFSSDQKLASQTTPPLCMTQPNHTITMRDPARPCHHCARPNQTTPPPCDPQTMPPLCVTQPDHATTMWPRHQPSKVKWALSPWILSLSDLMGFGVFIFLIWILGGCWGWIWLDLCWVVGLMLRFVGCIW